MTCLFFVVYTFINAIIVYLRRIRGLRRSCYRVKQTGDVGTFENQLELGRISQYGPFYE